MDLAEYYYEHAYGCYPFETNDEKDKTNKVIDYLVENHIDTGTIMAIIEKASSNKTGFLTPEDIYFYKPIWDNNLLEPCKFYYHPELQIRPAAPSFNPVTNETKTAPFYLEMRIRFTERDVANYIRRSIKMPDALYDEKRDLGSVNFLLNKYKNINVVEPIDFVLYLADHLRQREQMAVSILDIANAEQAVYEQCSRMVPEMAAKKANQIVWR